MSPDNKKPGLLIATTTFPRWADDPGPAPFVFHHARALAEHFEVTVLAPHYLGAKTEERLDGVTVKRFTYARPYRLEALTDGAGIRSNMRKGAFHRLLALPLTLSLLNALNSEIKSGAYDYINTHWLIPSGLAGAIAAPKNIPHVVTVHAADFDMLISIPGGKRTINYIAQKARAVVCVSKRLAGGIQSITGGKANILTMPMGVESERFFFSPKARSEWRERLGLGDEPVVLYAGKLSAKKGVEVLLRAASHSKDGGRAFRLVVAGDGSLRSALDERAGELGISGSVNFIGAVPNRELAGLYSAADAVAVPSVLDLTGETEGMPVVILEALAAGRPVIASRVCSAPDDLLDAGVIEFDPGDHEGLAESIQSALSGETRVNSEVVASYDVARVAEMYARILKGEGG